MTRRAPHTLSEGRGPAMWRSAEEKHADPEALQRAAEAEHQGGFVGDLLDPLSMVTRRSFMKGSSVAALAAGVQGCIRRPEDKIFPYSKAPEQLIPGVPSHFATVTSRERDALGVVVTNHDGRPTKIEGNAEHPSSLGSTDVRAQAYVWDLYDPDRSQMPARRQGGALANATDDDFNKLLADIVTKHEADQGAGLRVLAPISNSPSFRRLRDKVKARFPKASFYTFSPVHDDNVREGARIALGEPVATLADYTRANVVLSLGADFVADEPGAVRAARGFGQTRKIDSPTGVLGRLYAVESHYTATGSLADHRLRLPQADIEGYARALAGALTRRGVAGLDKLAGDTDAARFPKAWLDAVAADLADNRRRSIVVAGRAQPARVHALVHAINGALGNIGATIIYGPPIDAADVSCAESMRALKQDEASATTLLILGGNPVYDAPADVKLGEILGRDGLTSIHVSTHRDETSMLCSWHAPLTHELEAWGDQVALDGTDAVQQPLIAPLYSARSAIEVLGVLAGEEKASGYDIVQATAQATVPATLTFASVWRNALHRGVLVPGRPSLREVNVAGVAAALAAASKRKPIGANNIEVSFLPDPALYDGRHANNLWALELPRPMTQLVWDNAALMSPATRDALGLKNEQMIRLSRDGASVELPVWALPGHADFSVTLMLGWGRTAAGHYGNGQGFDVYPLRTSDAMDFVDGVSVQGLTAKYNLVQTQEHDRMEGRPIAIDATLDEYKAEPEFASYRSVELVNTPPLWKEVDYGEGYQWGMSIDLGACSGCNACVLACQSENNIPSVGKREVERGREMHWIRIDRYFVGDDENDPAVAMQPVACQQCEEAPCENVCPVNATNHSPEGLNDMAYNRCIGTRYCANNCPYKVRRFNYLDWHTNVEGKFQAMYGDFPESRKLQFNPNVTVRMRGVMEKCTYCVQRIQYAKIDAKSHGRTLKDGDIVTACQAACPTQAIVFGDLNDEKSQVAQLSKRDRRYKLLAELGTQPRTTYLARIRNPNPAMGKTGGSTT